MTKSLIKEQLIQERYNELLNDPVRVNQAADAEDLGKQLLEEARAEIEDEFFSE